MKTIKQLKKEFYDKYYWYYILSKDFKYIIDNYEWQLWIEYIKDKNKNVYLNNSIKLDQKEILKSISKFWYISWYENALTLLQAYFYDRYLLNKSEHVASIRISNMLKELLIN